MSEKRNKTNTSINPYKEAILFLKDVMLDKTEEYPIRLEAACEILTYIRRYKNEDWRNMKSDTISFLMDVMKNKSEEYSIRMRAAYEILNA